MNLGVRQVSEGDFEAAVFTLDSVVRKLTGRSEMVDELAWAYAYLGAAYVGLEHEKAAKGKFREALALRPTLRLSAGEFPPNVLRLFDSAVLERTAVKKRKGAKIALVAGGVGAAGAVGIAAATSGGAPSNRPPTVTIGMTPSDGFAVMGVTEMAFTASASDPDFDALTYAWSFGDGASASGQTASRIYATEGQFRVSLTVSDGRGGTVTETTAVTAGSLTGTWEDTSTSNLVDNVWVNYSYQLTQNGAVLQGSSFEPDTDSLIFAVLSNPRRVSLRLTERGRVSLTDCSGEVGSNLWQISCAQGDRNLALIRRR